MRTLAVELGPLGARVNLISPGEVAGPRIETVIREQAAANGTTWQAVVVPYGDCVEVIGSHVGLIFNRKVYGALAEPELGDARRP